MDHGSSWETNSSSTGQKVLRLLWNSKGHYPACKSPPLKPTLSQLNPDETSGILWSTYVQFKRYYHVEIWGYKMEAARFSDMLVFYHMSWLESYHLDDTKPWR